MRTLRKALVLIAFIACIGMGQAQTNVITFTNTTGEVFEDVKVVRVDGDGIIYTFTKGGGGGRLLFSQMPEEVVESIRRGQPAKPTFATTAGTATVSPGMFAQVAESQTGTNSQLDMASVVITNKNTWLIVTFARGDDVGATLHSVALSRLDSNPGHPKDVAVRIDDKKLFLIPTRGWETGSSPGSEIGIFLCADNDLKALATARKLEISFDTDKSSESYSVAVNDLLRNFGRFCRTNLSSVERSEKSKFLTQSAARNTVLDAPSFSSEFSEPTVVGASAKIVDTSSGYTYWAWKVDITSASAAKVGVELKFLDAQGYEIGNAFEYPVTVKPGTFSITGREMLKSAISKKVKNVKAIIK
jgi:hypothetical protein